jgi:hypothetical protein
MILAIRAGCSTIGALLGKRELLTIGWREYVALPEWGLFRIRAKIDTGARSCALDVHHLECLQEDRVRFEIALSRKDRSRVRHVEAAISRKTVVKSSLGDTHERIFVKTPLILAGIRQVVEVGLISREEMRSRMLIGRNALQGHYQIDPEARFLWPPETRPDS